MKCFFNKKRYHNAVTVEDDGKKRKNMDLTHQPRNSRYIELEKPNKYGTKSYVRKYINIDNSGVKGEKKNIKLSEKDKSNIIKYIKKDR